MVNSSLYRKKAGLTLFLGGCLLHGVSSPSGTIVSCEPNTAAQLSVATAFVLNFFVQVATRTCSTGWVTTPTQTSGLYSKLCWMRATTWRSLDPTGENRIQMGCVTLGSLGLAERDGESSVFTCHWDQVGDVALAENTTCQQPSIFFCL